MQGPEFRRGHFAFHGDYQHLAAVPRPEGKLVINFFLFISFPNLYVPHLRIDLQPSMVIKIETKRCHIHERNLCFGCSVAYHIGSLFLVG